MPIEHNLDNLVAHAASLRYLRTIAPPEGVPVSVEISYVVEHAAVAPVNEERDVTDPSDGNVSRQVVTVSEGKSAWIERNNWQLVLPAATATKAVAALTSIVEAELGDVLK